MNTTPPNPDHITRELSLRDQLPPPAERRAIRERLGLSRELVARDLGITQETLFQWETGGATPRRENLARYVAMLGRLRNTADARGEG